MSHRNIDRERMEIVFGLTGGELNDHKVGRWAYNYDGPPDHATKDYPDWHSADYLTVLDYEGHAPDSFEHEGTCYRKVGTYWSSGEAECTCNDCEALDMAAEGMGTTCPVCECDVTGEGRRYVYIGKGWSEVIYRGAPLHVADMAPGKG